MRRDFEDNSGAIGMTQAYRDKLVTKDLSKIINTLGQKVQSYSDNLLFYIYDDGTIEKRIAIE